jgi:hypothetical protein
MPLVTRISNHLDVTTNRDRLMRFVMYAARVVAAHSTATTAARLEVLAKAMTDGRRLVRQGKYVVTAAALTKSLAAWLPAKDRQVSGLLPILHQALLFGYLFIDQFVFLSKVGLLKLNTTDVLMLRSLQSWGLSVVVKLLIDCRAALAFARAGKDWRSAEGRTILLNIAKNTLDLPVVCTYLFPSPRYNSYLVNLSGMLGVCIDIYQAF